MKEYENEDQVKRNEDIDVRRMIRDYITKEYNNYPRSFRRKLERSTIKSMNKMVKEIEERNDKE